MVLCAIKATCPNVGKTTKQASKQTNKTCTAHRTLLLFRGLAKTSFLSPDSFETETDLCMMISGPSRRCLYASGEGRVRASRKGFVLVGVFKVTKHHSGFASESPECIYFTASDRTKTALRPASHDLIISKWRAYDT